MDAIEIRAVIAADEELHGLVPDTIALAAHPTFSEHAEVKEYWLTDRGLVADLTMLTGNTAMSDSVLSKLDAAAESSRSVKAIANRLYTDARGVNFGDQALLAWFYQMTQSGVFTQAEHDAIAGLSQQPAPVTEFEIRRAIFADNGELLV